MIFDKAILTFFGIALGIYFLSTIILIPNLHLERGVSDMTINLASTFYSKDVKWVSNHAPNKVKVTGPDIDVKVKTIVKGRGYEGVGKLTSRTKVLLPFIVLISLILATPISWKNKLIALGLGVLAFFIYLMFLFKWTIGYVQKVTEGAEISSLWFGQVFNTNIGFMTILPTIIWILVTLWAIDVNRFLNNGTTVNS